MAAIGQELTAADVRKLLRERCRRSTRYRDNRLFAHLPTQAELAAKLGLADDSFGKMLNGGADLQPEACAYVGVKMVRRYVADPEHFTANQVRDFVAKQFRGKPAKYIAGKIGAYEGHIRDVLARRTDPGRAIAKWLGVRREWAYFQAKAPPPIPEPPAPARREQLPGGFYTEEDVIEALHAEACTSSADEVMRRLGGSSSTFHFVKHRGAIPLQIANALGYVERIAYRRIK
jgi:hypothetical protein